MPSADRKQASGKVWLVGAGPGAADLLTLRAARLIAAADIVLHDALVSPEVLALAGPQARVIAVGKRGHRGAVPQDVTNRLMAKLARQGRTVVRLKGGDPSVFGRAAEEREHLEGLGVEVEVVPGVTTASAAAAQFGFSLTERIAARRVIFATGRTLAGPQLDWTSASDPDATLCLYMACADAALIAERLMEAGRDPATPAAAFANVAREDACMAVGRLDGLTSMAGLAPDGAPVLIVVGDAVRRVRAPSRLSNAMPDMMSPRLHG